MFLCAVVKPIYNEGGECLFDGKVGCWRVADWKKRKRNYNSKKTKYKQGDDYIVDCSMGASKYQEMLIGLLFGSITGVLPVGLCTLLYYVYAKHIANEPLDQKIK